MNTASSTDFLTELADNHYFILGAYFFAFFPWGVTSNIDFISEKWRTIRRTRNLAYIHLLASVVPVIYIGFYAEAQRRKVDSKEYGASLAALGFNLVHLMRTVKGMTQLDAFLAWCRHTMECVHALRGNKAEDDASENDGQENDASESDGQENDGQENDDVEGKVKMNNTVVDNELGGTDLSVRPSWSKIWNKVKGRVFRPSEWLVTDQVKLCTVRWSGAFLCGMGRDWSVPFARREVLDLFFSNSFLSLRSALNRVRWNIGEENNVFDLLSIEGLHWQLAEEGISGEMTTAYRTEIPRYHHESTFNSYAFELVSLTSSYPSSNDEDVIDNREKISLELVNSLVIAKHLGVKKLRRIRRFYDRCCIPTRGLRLKSMKVLLEQLGSSAWDDSKLFDMFADEQEIPIFPFRMQNVALWDESPNWRILQASAHEDIEVSLFFGRTKPTRMPFCQVQHHSESIFEYCADIVKWRVPDNQRRRLCFLGVVMETVRTFLAEWLVSGAREPDWEPAIPNDHFEFVLGLDLPEDHFEYENSLIWACQYALQNEVARMSSLQGNLPSSHALIMLFLLGSPLIRVENINPIESDEPSARPGASASVPNMDNSVDLSVRVWRVSTILAPQDISIAIHYDLETRRMSMSLRNNSGEARFIWQDWVNAAMGYLRGIDEAIDAKLKKNRTIVRADLRESMVEICPLRANNEGAVEKSGTARIWMGWLPFDVRVCKFEVEQLLGARNINLREVSDRNRSFVDEEVYRAERLIQTIISASTTEN